MYSGYKLSIPHDLQMLSSILWGYCPSFILPPFFLCTPSPFTSCWSYMQLLCSQKLCFAFLYELFVILLS